MLRKFQPGCSCCCGVVGFETEAVSEDITRCCDFENNQNHTAITNIAENIEMLEQCRVVFCGCRWFCPETPEHILAFHESDWPTIADWISTGGRLWVSAEYMPGCMSESAQERLHEFLAGIGCSMRTGADRFDSGCSLLWPGVINEELPMVINGEITKVLHASTNSVTGGIPICYGNEENEPFISIEAIGSGFIVLAGDSNITGGCLEFRTADNNNCQLINAYINLPDEEIL